MGYECVCVCYALDRKGIVIPLYAAEIVAKVKDPSAEKKERKLLRKILRSKTLSEGFTFHLRRIQELKESMVFVL